MDFWEQTRKLPLGYQSFSELRSRDVIYVDKTAYVYQLAANEFPQILTRPRRFGKSTLLSTIEELFLHGVKPLADQTSSPFKGLAIEQLWHDDGRYDVLHLDFSQINYNCPTIAQFEQKLIHRITLFCQDHELSVPDDKFGFGEMFVKVLEQVPARSLVLLIDEYDAPMIHHTNNEQELEACTLLMRSIFGSVKTNSKKFRCVFFTGVTRFQDLNLGTDGNNFTDWSYNEYFASCCGYTRNELKQYFAEHLRYAAAVRAGCALEAVNEEQVELLLDDLSAWYDGYSFDGSEQNKVFSTWSVLRFFADAKARSQPYWSNEEGRGLPQVLKIALDRINIPKILEDMKVGELAVDPDQFIQSSLINPEANPYSLLFQTGYLTLSQPFDNGDYVHLSCPNKEIRIAFGNLLGRRIFNIRKRYTLTYILQTLEILSSLDPEKIRKHFNGLFAELPYDHYPITSESVVQGYIFFHLKTLGLKPHLEVMSSKGRADCVFDLPESQLTFVFEFKFESSSDPQKLDAKLAEALKQIKDRKYALGANSEPRIARFGLVFCSDPSERCFTRVALADVSER